jgi:hypothetical protein
MVQKHRQLLVDIVSASGTLADDASFYVHASPLIYRLVVSNPGSIPTATHTAGSGMQNFQVHVRLMSEYADTVARTMARPSADRNY